MDELTDEERAEAERIAKITGQVWAEFMASAAGKRWLDEMMKGVTINRPYDVART